MDSGLRLDFLDGLQRSGIVPGLGRIRPLLDRLGNPHRKFESVLIAGTNGKGSTAAFLESILRAAGYRTGLFTSPHLADVRERVRISGRMLAPGALKEYGLRVRSAMDGHGADRRATYFEALTAIGFTAFAGEGVEIAVVEVGMGGTHDSTNTLDPLVSVLTNVSLDHQRYLGDNLADIAREKVGVARPDRVFVTGVSLPLFEDVVEPAVLGRGARPRLLGRDFRVHGHDGNVDWQGACFRVHVSLPLRGTFQADNAALAVAAAEALRGHGLEIDESHVQRGLSSTSWPGRFQEIGREPLVIVDGCHNPGAAARLAETLDTHPMPRPLVLVHGSRPAKDYGGVLGFLVPRCDGCVVTSCPGLADTGSLAAAARAAGAPDPVQEPDPMAALELAQAKAGGSGSVLVTGSLYLVGALMRAKGLI